MLIEYHPLPLPSMNDPNHIKVIDNPLEISHHCPTSSGEL